MPEKCTVADPYEAAFWLCYKVSVRGVQKNLWKGEFSLTQAHHRNVRTCMSIVKPTALCIQYYL